MERIEPGRGEVIFHTASGALTVQRTTAGYLMNFPARMHEPTVAPAGLAEALRAALLEVYVNSFNYMAVVENAQALRALAPDMAAISRLDRPGVIVTAPGSDTYDFVSRYFAPAKGIPEDPVTGAAHCMLAPYWSKRLNKTQLRAFQASPRGGEVLCRTAGERVQLEGSCIFYLEGTIEI
jgi:predicted PhzF superfamily epimerase YddE/YHI9